MIVFWPAQGATPRMRASAERQTLNAVSLVATARGEHLALIATGAWTVEQATELERLIDEAARRHAEARGVDIDLGSLERLDSFGAWLVERLKRTFTQRGSTARIVGLSATDRGLIEELALVNRTPAPDRVAPNRILLALNSVGRGVAEIGWSLVLLIQLLGALTHVVLGTIAHPARLRLTSTVHQLERVGWRAVPIIL